MRTVDSKELVILTEPSNELDADAQTRDFDASFHIRLVPSAELAAASVWTDNWRRILSYLVANRGLVPLALQEAIAQFLKDSQRLPTIEREFTTYDLVIVRASLFSLLHTGRVSAPELLSKPLSLLTSFAAA